MKVLIIFSILLFYTSTIFGTETEINVNVYTEKIGSNYNVYADNKEYCPVSIKINFKLKNLKNTIKNDSIIVIPARSFEYLITELKPTVSAGEFSFSYNLNYNYGDVTVTQFDSDFIYQLPYAKGKKFRISQGYFGKSTHKGINALDFNMPLKTPIYAARGGIVARVVDTNTLNCFDEDCSKYNNYILIYHSDGTFSQYAHIFQNGSKVAPGDVVKKGQFLCYSGNTGYSSGPHLHFSVYLPRLDEPEYVQTYFKTKKQEYTILKEGKTYKN